MCVYIYIDTSIYMCIRIMFYLSSLAPAIVSITTELPGEFGWIDIHGASTG